MNFMLQRRELHQPSLVSTATHQAGLCTIRCLFYIQNQSPNISISSWCFWSLDAGTLFKAGNMSIWDWKMFQTSRKSSCGWLRGQWHTEIGKKTRREAGNSGRVDRLRCGAVGSRGKWGEKGSTRWKLKETMKEENRDHMKETGNAEER